MHPQSIPSVLFENELFFCIFKPAGYHSSQGKGQTSVADWIAKEIPTIISFGRSPVDCGLLNRLDHDTSGILIAAKSIRAKEIFIEYGEKDEIQKKYLCLTYENSFLKKNFVCDFEIGSEARNSTRVTVNPPSGETKLRYQPAHTEFALLGSDQLFNHRVSLYDATITNGRRHQIRAHAAASGISLVNDTLYKRANQLMIKEIGDSFFLHNYQIISQSLNLNVTCPIDLRIGAEESALNAFLRTVKH